MMRRCDDVLSMCLFLVLLFHAFSQHLLATLRDQAAQLDAADARYHELQQDMDMLRQEQQRMGESQTHHSSSDGSAAHRSYRHVCPCTTPILRIDIDIAVVIAL